MKIAFIERLGGWNRVLRAARSTRGLRELSPKEPTSKWKLRILLAEHSPIRKLWVNWMWESLFYWVSVHFVRHKYGIEHFVESQRPDNTLKKILRKFLSQEELVLHECEANAQALLNISRRRLCLKCPSPETREAWKAMLTALEPFEPELVSVCVKECVYRGFCYEMDPKRTSCGYFKTEAYRKELASYRAVFCDTEVSP